MKQTLILVLVIATLSFASCEEDYVKPAVPAQVPVLRISSFYPESGLPGSTVAVFGENFGTAISDNYVTFNGIRSEVTQVQSGAIVLRVPLNLPQGDYHINVLARNQTVTSSDSFKVYDVSPNK